MDSNDKKLKLSECANDIDKDGDFGIKYKDNGFLDDEVSNVHSDYEEISQPVHTANIKV